MIPFFKLHGFRDPDGWKRGFLYFLPLLAGKAMIIKKWL
jgi:hypothetical protein